MDTIYWKLDREHVMVYSEAKEKSKIKNKPIATYTHMGNKRPFAYQWITVVGSNDQVKIFETLGIKKKNYVKS